MTDNDDLQRISAALTDAIHELTQPRTHREPFATYNDGTWTHLRHHTEVPSLLAQLDAAVEPSSSGEGGRSHPGSKPTARLEAIDVLLRIEQHVRGWVDKCGLTGRHQLTHDLGSLLAHHTRLEPLDQWLLARDARKWRSWARVTTGWETPSWKPDNTCPLCGQRGGLRVRLGDGIDTQGAHAMCVLCGEAWDSANVALLADHIRWENDDEQATA